MARKPNIAAIRVDYTKDAPKFAARYEPEQSFYWVARLNENKPSQEYTVHAMRSPYVDNLGHPLYFVRITHTPSKLTLYVRKCEIIEGK